MLDLVQRQTRLLGNGLERERAVVRAALEHGLNERHEADLLTEEGVVLLQDGLLREERRERLELANVALVEREQQLLDPVVWRVVQRVKNRV